MHRPQAHENQFYCLTELQQLKGGGEILRFSIFFRGELAAGRKATAGNGWENGMGMTEGTEYME